MKNTPMGENEKCINCLYCQFDDGEIICSNEYSENYGDYIENDYYCEDYEAIGE